MKQKYEDHNKNNIKYLLFLDDYYNYSSEKLKINNKLSSAQMNIDI